jgi:alpha-ketoglutaric semialdehyde dehydrogenase
MEENMLTGEMLIGADWVRGTEGSFRAIDPATGEAMDPEFAQGGSADVDRAARAAADAFDEFRATAPTERARLLDTIADNIEAIGPDLLARGHAESGLPLPRLENERNRTTAQLRLFADLLRRGTAEGVRIDPALPERTPPRVDIRQRLVALGPVAVFGASNFPLAFSNAGGDTASALAAGCPVIVKVHNAHPGTGMMVAGAVRAAVEECGMPAGTYSALIGPGTSIGAALVAHPAVKAVGFTGSRSGGLALVRIAQSRPEPIPVYAEMSSINPVFVLPSRATPEVAREYAASLTLGSGQFCTNPGLAFVPRGEAGDTFVSATADAIAETPGQTMLTPGICDAFREGVAALEAAPGVTVVGRGRPGEGENAPAPVVFAADVELLSAESVLQDEIFGAASLILRYDSIDELVEQAERLEGQLTATIQATQADLADARRLMPVLERKVGRILYNGWPTGVEVNDAMVHGGPFPSTSDPRMTSVGTLAITRFQRPVAYQNLPAELLPPALADDNPWHTVRLVDGAIEGLER